MLGGIAQENLDLEKCLKHGIKHNSEIINSVSELEVNKTLNRHLLLSYLVCLNTF